MNVVFVTSSIGYGGAEKIMSFVADFLSKNGHSVVILNLNAVPVYVNEYTQSFNENIKVISLEKCNRNKHRFRIQNIISVVKEYKADIMVAFTMFPNFYAEIVALLTGIPAIMSERGNPYITFSKSLKDRIIYNIINQSKGGVFQTKEASLFYGKRLRKRSIVIPNPISLKNTTIPIIAMQDRRKTVVSVGRFQNVQKRYDVMLKAFQRFSQRYPDYTLKLYGSGEDEVLIRNWINELNISDKVELPGAIKNPIEHIYKDGIFVITSDYEGIPNALLEAMAVGLPVVATDCSPGGARLLIQDGENGQIVPTGNYEAVTTALSRYADDMEFAGYCGNNARKVLQTFAPSVIGEQWEAYIMTIANKK